MAEDRVAVQVAGVRLELSNLDKVLYAQAGYTKGEVIDYYTRVAPILLPHLANRPLTTIRYPNGVDTKGFFEKNAPQGSPRWVRTERLPAPGSTMGRDTLAYVVVDDLPTLVWLANLAALELHVPQWTIGAPGPDRLVVDLDPGPPAGLRECGEVALLLRDRLARDGLRAYPKTSGRKGMQLMCALSGTRPASDVSAYAKRLAEELARAKPKLIVAQMSKNLRPRKVFIDWSQNSAAKTTVAPYSLRAVPVPAASTPLTWDEVESGELRQFGPAEVLARIEEHGDLFAELCTGGPELPT
jgi:bifunctional non-homologous end joining protein LigD